jgi:hypothetical protein
MKKMLRLFLDDRIAAVLNVLNACTLVVNVVITDYKHQII